eukprot:jgi/Mesvir1/12289/Mv26425-RA.1
MTRMAVCHSAGGGSSESMQDTVAERQQKIPNHQIRGLQQLSRKVVGTDCRIVPQASKGAVQFLQSEGGDDVVSGKAALLQGGDLVVRGRGGGRWWRRGSGDPEAGGRLGVKRRGGARAPPVKETLWANQRSRLTGAVPSPVCSTGVRCRRPPSRSRWYHMSLPWLRAWQALASAMHWAASAS